MKAVILAGGMGTRISEESHTRPKPMVEIGGKPILWHIMKIYSHYGVNEFIICLGYKGYIIKEYFANYFLHMSDVTFHMDQNRLEVHSQRAEPWVVTLVDTGIDAMTGGRLKKVTPYLGEEDFCFTYGDGLADIDIGALIKFHQEGSALATVTAVTPPGRYGSLRVDKSCRVTGFTEKPPGDGATINGGFFVLSPKVIDYIKDADTHWEGDPMQRLATEGQLRAYGHGGFWQAMDTLRDRNHLEGLYQAGVAPWIVWD